MADETKETMQGEIEHMGVGDPNDGPVEVEVRDEQS